MRRMFLAGVLVLLSVPQQTQAQVISIDFFFAPYIEIFDSMGAAGTTTPSGWFVGSGATASSTTVTVGTGSSATGGNYNFGLSLDPDRALGSLASGTGGTRNTEARFVNSTGADIGSLDILYEGEQWRLGASPSFETGLTLQYSTDGVSFVPLGSTFNFPPPVVAGTVGALDGNLPPNRTSPINGVYTPASPIPNGTTFYLRWVDLDDTGFDSGMAIDNAKIFAIPVPEPHEYAFTAGLGLLGFALIRRQMLKRA